MFVNFPLSVIGLDILSRKFTFLKLTKEYLKRVSNYSELFCHADKAQKPFIKTKISKTQDVNSATL